MRRAALVQPGQARAPLCPDKGCRRPMELQRYYDAPMSSAEEAAKVGSLVPMSCWTS